MSKNNVSFRVSVETEVQTGEVIAVYFQIRTGRTKTTKEYAGGNLFADYDKDGRLLGVEMLAPCRAAVLDRIATEKPEKQFLRNAVPRGMLLHA